MTNDEQDQVKQTLRRLMREEMDGLSEINVPEAAQRVIAKLKVNPVLLDRVLEAYAMPIAHVVGLEVLRSQRQGPVIETGETLTTKGAVEERARRMVARWQQWTEYNGQLHKAIPEMTGTDLLAAAGFRRKVADTHHRTADWLEEMAGLVGERTVSEVLSDDDVTAIYMKHFPAVPTVLTIKMEEEAAD